MAQSPKIIETKPPDNNDQNKDFDAKKIINPRLKTKKELTIVSNSIEWKVKLKEVCRDSKYGLNRYIQAIGILIKKGITFTLLRIINLKLFLTEKNNAKPAPKNARAKLPETGKMVQ